MFPKACDTCRPRRVGATGFAGRGRRGSGGQNATRLICQTDVGVRDELSGHVRDGEVLQVVLERILELGGALQLKRDADAIAREGLAHNVTRLEARAQQVLVATKRLAGLAHVVVQHAAIEHELRASKQQGHGPKCISSACRVQDSEQGGRACAALAGFPARRHALASTCRE